MRVRPGFALFGLLLGSPAFGQTTIQYDSVVADADAAISCGFCAPEKFGVIFKELQGGGGLPSSSFPLTLDSVQFALANVAVTGDILSGYMCGGLGSGGAVDVGYEVYAGQTAPTDIKNMPASGAWPGEATIVPLTTVSIQRSADTPAGSNQWSVQLNSIPVNLPVQAPNTYIRVAITIPAGGSSASCMELSFDSPNGVPFRDDNGVIASQTNFIHQLGFPLLNIAPEWTWNEEVSDPISGMSGIGGDWLVRIEISSSGGPIDAGVTDAAPGDTGADGGPDDVGTGDAQAVDSGDPGDAGAADSSPMDTGPTDSGGLVDAATGDAGSLPAPTIIAISPTSGRSDRATDVVVTGTGFRAGLSLRIGAIAATDVVVSGASTIQATVPVGVAAATYDVIVENPDGQAAVLQDGFTVQGDDTTEPTEDDGCSCNATQSAPRGGWSGLFLGLLMLARRRR